MVWTSPRHSHRLSVGGEGDGRDICRRAATISRRAPMLKRRHMSSTGPSLEWALQVGGMALAVDPLTLLCWMPPLHPLLIGKVQPLHTDASKERRRHTAPRAAASNLHPLPQVVVITSPHAVQTATGTEPRRRRQPRGQARRRRSAAARGGRTG